MEIKIYAMTVEEYLDFTSDITAEDVAEWYGDNIVRIYWAEAYDESGGFAGVEYEDGSYAVYGCNLDKEGITRGKMLEVLTWEFLH